MFEVSVLVGIPMLLVLNALDNYFQRQKLKELEKEMREKGIDEETIIIARHFFKN